MKYKIGDKVLLKNHSLYYKQAPGVVGEIMGEFPGVPTWVHIKWNQSLGMSSRPKEDNYPIEDLIPETKLAKLLLGIDT